MRDLGDQLRIYVDSVIADQPDPGDLVKELLADEASAMPAQVSIGGAAEVGPSSDAHFDVSRRRSWPGPAVAVAVFVAVLAVGGLAWLLSPFGAGSSPVDEPTGLPTTGPGDWPGFELTFVAGPDEDRGRVMWVDADTWRIERATRPDPQPGRELIIEQLESGGETERAAAMRDALDSDAMQIIFAVNGETTTVGSARDPNQEGVPLSLFTAAMPPSEAVGSLLAGEAIDIEPATPTHPLAQSAVVAVGDAVTVRAEFTEDGIPVLIESSDPDGPYLRAESLTPSSFDWTEVVSPHPDVRQYATQRMPLVAADIRPVLSDGVITLAEYRQAVEATIECVRPNAPEVTFSGPRYNPAYGQFDYEFSHTSSEVLDTADAAYQNCYEKYEMQIVDVWMLQFGPEDQIRLSELAERVPSDVDIESANAEPTEPVPVGAGDGWSLNAYRKGPAVCFEFETQYGGTYGCVPPRDWDVPIFLMEGTGESDGVRHADLLGTTAPSVAGVVLEFPDGHTMELQPSGRDTGFPVNFIGYTFDPDRHGLPATASAYNSDGTLLDQLELFENLRP